MRRTLLLAGLTALLLVLGLTLIVQVRSVDEPLPAPDLAMPIHMPDGTVQPLAEVLAQERAPRPVTPAPTPLITGAPPAQPPLTHEKVNDLIRDALDREHSVFRLAEVARREGRLDEALALYLSVPEDSDSWARAQRRIGWDILSCGKGEPRRGVSYVKTSLAANPFSGNGWQDLARVYAGTLGVGLD